MSKPKKRATATAPKKAPAPTPKVHEDDPAPVEGFDVPVPKCDQPAPVEGDDNNPVRTEDLPAPVEVLAP